MRYSEKIHIPILQIISLAAEGINIGKEGPVTLLQIGTCPGHVYLFDLLVNRDLVHKGRLKYVLEDSDIQKVEYSTGNNSANKPLI